MVFSTIIFLLRFLPITLALYYLAPPKLKNTVLFLCSLVFYCWGEVRFFPVMLALILINYLCGLGLERFEQNKPARLILLLIALAGSLGMLFYFKYANFVLSSINAIFGTGFAPIQGISVLPLGISFYTFQTLSYTIDVYRRDVETEHNIIDFGAYVVMFPQLIAGPIVKYRDVSDRLHVYKGRCELKQIEDGMTLFTFGLAKKVLLADAIGALWTDIIGVADSPSVSFVGLANASTPLVWLGGTVGEAHEGAGGAVRPADDEMCIRDSPSASCRPSSPAPAAAARASSSRTPARAATAAAPLRSRRLWRPMSLRASTTIRASASRAWAMPVPTAAPQVTSSWR